MFKNRVKQISSSQFIRHNAIFFVGSMAVAFINYLYYPVLGRLLSNTSFGELQVVVSTFMQISIILNVFSLVAINIYINQNKKIAEATVGELEKIALWVGFGLLVIITILSEPLKTALKFDSALPFMAIAVAFIITIPLTFRTSYLKAQKSFTSASILGFVGSTAKLIFSALLVLLALKTFGAIIGIALSQLVALLYANRQASKNGFYSNNRALIRRKPNWKLIKPELPYAGFVFGMSLLTTLQISIDVTLVKYFFSPSVAGSYAAIATIARIIFFLIGSVIAVMTSSIGQTKSSKANAAMLKKSLWLVMGLGGVTTIIFSIFPKLIIHILLGQRYETLSYLLPLLSLAIFIGSIVSLFATYMIALRKYSSMIIVSAGSLITFVSIAAISKTVEHIVLCILVGSSVTLIGLVFYTLIDHYRSLKEDVYEKA